MSKYKSKKSDGGWGAGAVPIPLRPCFLISVLQKNPAQVFLTWASGVNVFETRGTKKSRLGNLLFSPGAAIILHGPNLCSTR